MTLTTEYIGRYCTGCALALDDCECGELWTPRLFDDELPQPVKPMERTKPIVRKRRDMPWRGDDDFRYWHIMRRSAPREHRQ